MKPLTRADFQKWGAQGGAATGKRKARTKAQARKAAQSRWRKHGKGKDA